MVVMDSLGWWHRDSKPCWYTIGRIQIILFVALFCCGNGCLFYPKIWCLKVSSFGWNIRQKFSTCISSVLITFAALLDLTKDSFLHITWQIRHEIQHQFRLSVLCQNKIDHNFFWKIKNKKAVIPMIYIVGEFAPSIPTITLFIPPLLKYKKHPLQDIYIIPESNYVNPLLPLFPFHHFFPFSTQLAPNFFYSFT